VLHDQRRQDLPYHDEAMYSSHDGSKEVGRPPILLIVTRQDLLHCGCVNIFRYALHLPSGVPFSQSGRRLRLSLVWSGCFPSGRPFFMVSWTNHFGSKAAACGYLEKGWERNASIS
jgi:hypothetical protein